MHRRGPTSLAAIVSVTVLRRAQERAGLVVRVLEAQAFVVEQAVTGGLRVDRLEDRVDLVLVRDDGLLGRSARPAP